jgi:glycosyltransferase involved in cell wall biosynthesis
MISIIIPCYNSEACVGRAIESVLRQTYTNYEIILVDNNSTDNTIEVLYEFEKKFPNTIKVFQEYTKGAPAARNKGLSEAKGEWLQFLDSDDELLPDKLRHQINLTTDANVDLIVGNCFKLRDGEIQQKEWIVRAITTNPWKALIKSRLGNTCNNLWRKEAVLSAGGWNVNMTSSDEYELLFRLLKNNVRIRYYEVPETIVHLRKNSINRSENDERLYEILDNFINLRLAIRQHLESEGKLTRELKYAIVKRIYFRLLPYKKRIPNYVDLKLIELKSELPVGFTLLQNLKQLKINTKNFIKNIFSLVYKKG